MSPFILKNHPFPVQAFFDKSLVLGFCLPREAIEKRVPAPLQLDLVEDRWAFLAMAAVDTRGLRPRGFPRFAGRDFLLIGYRVFVRYRTRGGRRLRGLYILGSETDRSSMRWLGSLFTRYGYEQARIDWTASDVTETIESDRGLRTVARRPAGEADFPALPTESPFADWKAARRFVGPMPFTFSVDERAERVVMVEGVRSSWRPLPVQVEEWRVPFFEERGLGELRLANAFLVEKVPYQWKRGRVETWKQEG